MGDYQTGGQWPPVMPPNQPRQPVSPATLSGPVLPDRNRPNTVYRSNNGLQEGVKTALMMVCLCFMIVALVDLLTANYLFVRAIIVAQDIAHQLGQ